MTSCMLKHSAISKSKLPALGKWKQENQEMEEETVVSLGWLTFLKPLKSHIMIK